MVERFALERPVAVGDLRCPGSGARRARPPRRPGSAARPGYRASRGPHCRWRRRRRPCNPLSTLRKIVPGRIRGRQRRRALLGEKALMCSTSIRPSRRLVLLGDVAGPVSVHCFETDSASRRGRRPRRKGRLEIVEHGARGRCPRCAGMLWRLVIQSSDVVPLPARLPLLGDELEIVAGGAGVEGLVAPGSGRRILGRLVARREAPDAVRSSRAPPSSEQARESRGRARHDCRMPQLHQATRIATRCIGLPP